jgi:hypothetical protein
MGTMVFQKYPDKSLIHRNNPIIINIVIKDFYFDLYAN